MTLKEYCASNGFTRKKLAVDAHVGMPKVWQLFSESPTRLHLLELFRLCKVLKVSPSQIVAPYKVVWCKGYLYLRDPNKISLNLKPKKKRRNDI